MHNCILWREAVKLRYHQLKETTSEDVKKRILEIVGKAFDEGVLFDVLTDVVKTKEGTWSVSFEEAASKYL